MKRKVIITTTQFLMKWLKVYAEGNSMNLKYRKKPVVINAWQFTKENYKRGVPKEFRHSSVTLWSQYGGDIIGGEVVTLEGCMEVLENDWIIKGVQGEYYPCKPEIFDLTYEPVDED